MENMLIRTRHNKCKARVAVLIRVVLFFGIPLFYFLFVASIKSVHNVNVGSARKDPDLDFTDHLVLRRLLGIVEPHAKNCTQAAILEFPSDGFTRFQRKHGFIAVHCVLAIYCFLLLGTVCEHYFVPAIEIICSRLEMAEDIAGATFMAAASSSPELFINCVGTFVTEGDLGVGAVVGSAVFNVLAVPAFCGLLAGQAINLDWWSVSRDCLMYAVAVVALILTLLDDQIFWHEALLLVLMYTLYILAMVFNGKLGSFAKSGCCSSKKTKMYTELTPLLIKDKNARLNARALSVERFIEQSELGQAIEMSKRHDSTSSESSMSSLWSFPDEKTSIFKKMLWVLIWPISLVLWLTIPDCRKHPRLYPLTFILCVAWIGGVSYLVAWLITILGDTLDVPDSITGLTILAAGTSLPEAVSSVVVTNQGYGTMGISNTIGSNTFDILLCLGLPWLIKSLFYPTIPGHHWVTINSSGLSYSAISLLSTLFAMYGSLAINKFQLDYKVGIICMLIYVAYLALATLIELNVFFPVNLPVCQH